MDHESILRLIAELRRCHGELEGVEAKAAHKGTPADLFKPSPPSPTGQAAESCSSAWTKTPVSRSWAWATPRKLQEDLSGLAAQMEPPLRPRPEEPEQ